MRLRSPRALIEDEAGVVTVEFVAVMLFFLFIVFFVIEVTLAMFWWKTAEKATQLGARLAVVSDPVTAGVPSSNGKDASTGAIYGQSCGPEDSPFPCTGFDTVSCTGTGCTNTAAFERIVGRMRNIFAVIDDANVTFSYSYAGMGYAGGPAIPLVTVTLSGVPFQTGFISILGSIIGSGGPLVTLPPITARLTGEDMSTGGS